MACSGKRVFRRFKGARSFGICRIRSGGMISDRIVNSGNAKRNTLTNLLTRRNMGILVYNNVNNNTRATLARAKVRLYTKTRKGASRTIRDCLGNRLMSSKTGYSRRRRRRNRSYNDRRRKRSYKSDYNNKYNKYNKSRPRLAKHGMKGAYHARCEKAFGSKARFSSSCSHNRPLRFVYNTNRVVEKFSTTMTSVRIKRIVSIRLVPRRTCNVTSPGTVFAVRVTRLPNSRSLAINRRMCLSGRFNRPFPIGIATGSRGGVAFSTGRRVTKGRLGFGVRLMRIGWSGCSKRSPNGGFTSKATLFCALFAGIVILFMILWFADGSLSFL